jgi:murein DD-endopeptidase MepM/ murein hydrolase activator NlpD
MVVLRHTGAFSTAYGHLSGFAKGLKPGMRVNQGDIIGFVGATGWATGPHLHYEFRVGGEARNPVAVALPPAEPIPASELAAYRTHSAALVARLDMLGSSQLAALSE